MKTDYIDFQDRQTPKAYFLSFRGYGTWLHGDAKFSMDRRNYNRFGGDKIGLNENLRKHELSTLKNQPFLFDDCVRKIIVETISEVCDFRQYRLVAINARTNHVHCVVSGKDKPELIMNSFKSYITRNLRKQNLIGNETKIWSRHGSTKYLWTDNQIEKAVDYVLHGQGDEPSF